MRESSVVLTRFAQKSVCGLFTALMFACSSPEQPHERNNAEGTNAASGYTEIPLHLDGGLWIVDAGAGRSRSRLRLIFDTGAPTSLRTSVAFNSSVGAHPIGEPVILGDGYGHIVKAAPAILSLLSVGSIAFDDVPILTLDSPLFDRFCPPVDGVLGPQSIHDVPALFERTTVNVNLDKGVVQFHKDSAYRAEGGVTLPLQRYTITKEGLKVDEPIGAIPIGLEGQLVWAKLDTGAAGLSEMSLDVFNALGRSVKEEGVVEYEGQYATTVANKGFDGESWVAMIDNVRIGGLELGKVPFRVVNHSKTPHTFLMLHQDLLSRFNYSFDFRRNEVKFIPRETKHSGKIAPQVRLDVVGGRLIVVGLLTGGVAQTAGLQIGDELLVLNGSRISRSDPRGICGTRTESWNLPDGNQVVVQRGGDQYKIWIPGDEVLFRGKDIVAN